MTEELLDKISELLFGRKYTELIVSEQLRLDQAVNLIEKQERERIKKSINDYYARPDVEQGIVGFTQAVRQTLKEEK